MRALAAVALLLALASPVAAQPPVVSALPTCTAANPYEVWLAFESSDSDCTDDATDAGSTMAKCCCLNGSVYACKGSSGGSAITLDLGDDGGNDSTALTEIATERDDTLSVIEESNDKLRFDPNYIHPWPRYGYRCQTEYMARATYATQAHVNADCFFTSATGTSATTNVLANTDAAHPGVGEFVTGSTSTGGVQLHASGLAGSALLFGGGRWIFETLVQLPDLSDGTQTYTAILGFYDDITFAINEAGIADGVFIQYSSDINGGEWQGVCKATGGGAATTVDSNSVVAADTWYRLTIVVNAAGTSVEFFINGTSFGTCSTASDIPVAAGEDTGGGGVAMQKRAGNTARSLYIDYVVVDWQATTAR